VQLNETFEQMAKNLIQLSKSMSWLLRHGACKAGVRLCEDGSILVQEMLTLREFSSYSERDVLDVVSNDDKQRFQLSGKPALNKDLSRYYATFMVRMGAEFSVIACKLCRRPRVPTCTSTAGSLSKCCCSH
jgi:hypothetical protein